MRSFLLAPLLALAACATVPASQTPPRAGHDHDSEFPSDSPRTTDEQMALAIELAYSAALTAAETAVDQGLVRGTCAVEMASLSEHLNDKVKLVRQAFLSGSESEYNIAARNAITLIGQFLNTIPKKGVPRAC